MGDRPVRGDHKVHLRVAIPNLRQLVTEVRPELAAADDAGAAALVEHLWAGDTYDEMHVAVDVLRLRPSLVNADLVERWANDLDHWAVTDDLATVVRTWVAEDPPERFPILERLTAADDVWRRRLGILSTVAMSRTGDQIERTLALIDGVSDDRRQKVVNAISWALRAMVASAPDRVATYVEDRADDLPARVRLEVWNKLRTGRKDGQRVAAGGSRAETIRSRFEKARTAVADRRAARETRDRKATRERKPPRDRRSTGEGDDGRRRSSR